MFRVRVGDYRVLFSIDEAAEVVTIELIRTRGDVYTRCNTDFRKLLDLGVASI